MTTDPKGVHTVDPLSPEAGKKGVGAADTLQGVHGDGHPWRGAQRPRPHQGPASDAHPWQRIDGPVSVDVTFFEDMAAVSAIDGRSA